MAQKQVYLVPEQYIDQIHAIGNQIGHHIIVCDHGFGPCIEADEIDGNDLKWGLQRALVKVTLKLQKELRDIPEYDF